MSLEREEELVRFAMKQHGWQENDDIGPREVKVDPVHRGRRLDLLLASLKSPREIERGEVVGFHHTLSLSQGNGTRTVDLRLHMIDVCAAGYEPESDNLYRNYAFPCVFARDVVDGVQRAIACAVREREAGIGLFMPRSLWDRIILNAEQNAGGSMRHVIWSTDQLQDVAA